MHPALFLLNSCILYVEQIIQKKGGNHSISVMFQSIRNRECMVAKYHHRPIPTTPAAGNVKTYYRDKLPAWAKKKISRKYPLYTKNGEKVCERYERIVIGDYGAYVEISASHLSDNHFIYIDQNDPIDETISSRHSSHMTLALNDESSYTIYFQVKPVPYGSFIPGRFYIDPYDVISDIREK